MTVMEQKRRVPRIPVSCPVGIREKSSAWTTETLDVGARGCRIALERPLSRGTLVQLRFDRGGAAPLDVLGQVAWTRASPPRAAGIVFVSLPRDPSGVQARSWIDALVAAQLRHVLAAWPASNGALARLCEVPVQLGIPPTEPLDRSAVALIRLARDGVRIGAVSRSADALRVLVELLDREVLSVSRETPDPEGWKQAFARFASWTVAAQPPPARAQR
jgi:hypothetical protein